MKRDTKHDAETGRKLNMGERYADAIAENKTELWIGTIPDIFGYGMSVAAHSEKAAMKALRADYKRWKKEQGTLADPTTTFAGSFENFGGYVRKVEIGKVYYDNFGE